MLANVLTIPSIAHIALPAPQSNPQPARSNKRKGRQNTMRKHFEDIVFTSLKFFWATIAVGLGAFAVLRIGHWLKILSEAGKVWAGI